jgi:hypothetical protein
MKLDPKQLKKLSELKKLESVPPSTLKAAGRDEMVTVIVHVKEPNYVPPQVQVRARIDPMLFTATLPIALLSELEADPKVQSMALSRPQKLID